MKESNFADDKLLSYIVDSLFVSKSSIEEKIIIYSLFSTLIHFIRNAKYINVIKVL